MHPTGMSYATSKPPAPNFPHILRQLYGIELHLRDTRHRPLATKAQSSNKHGQRK